MCMQYEADQEYVHDNDEDNNNSYNNTNNVYGDVFDTTNINIDSDCYYTNAINNYQPRNYQIYFDDECNEFPVMSNKSANYECVSNAPKCTHKPHKHL